MDVTYNIEWAAGELTLKANYGEDELVKTVECPVAPDEEGFDAIHYAAYIAWTDVNYLPGLDKAFYSVRQQYRNPSPEAPVPPTPEELAVGPDGEELE